MDRKYILGLDEVSSELNKGYDLGLKNKNIAYFASLLKVKTLRVWLNYSEIIKVKENDEFEFIPDGVKRMSDYLNTMKEAGVERFALLTWGFVYPYGYECDDKFVVPDPEKEADIYKRFIFLQSHIYEEMAKKFPDIQYFEPTNEPEGFDGINIHRNHKFFKEPFAYPLPILERIVLDLCFYMSKGIKKYNSDCQVVFPGFCNLETTPSFVNDIYCLIESNTCPSFSEKSNKIDDYFNIMNWHPYNLKDAEINDYWLFAIERIRNVMKNHNDNYRKIWFNEIGWSDLRRETELNVIKERYRKLMKVAIEKLDFVETIFPYRLFTLATRLECEGDDNFGLVYNEYDWDEPLSPKPSFIELYKFINGESADVSPCYGLSKKKTHDTYSFIKEDFNNNSYKVMFIGNAITYRKEANWLNWNVARGLGSSSIEKDYAHLVISYLKDKYKNVSSILVDATNWETTFYDSMTLNKLKEINNQDLDLLIVSLGDNFGDASLHDQPVTEYYKNLFSLFNVKQIIVTSPFAKHLDVIPDIKKALKNPNESFVDISNISRDSNNLADNPVINNRFDLIPNDLGHSLIAQEIIKVIK